MTAGYSRESLREPLQSFLPVVILKFSGVATWVPQDLEILVATSLDSIFFCHLARTRGESTKAGISHWANALFDGLDGSIRVNLVRQKITKLEEAGAECISVTCDGTNCNIPMLTVLGVCFDSPLRSSFPNPSDPFRKAHGHLNACHMLKLIGNLLAEKQCIRNGAGRVVACKYLEALDSPQQQEGLHAANKLRKKHTDFQRKKMKVSLATETLSQSVSCALLVCKEKGIRGFEGVEATAEFAAAVDNIFDLSNSCHPLGRGSKAPVRAVNKDTMLTRIDHTSHYLRGLKDSTGQPLRCLLTRKLSQDHLELFFSTVRNRTGNNDNPKALEFRWAYRKCRVGNVQPSTRGNCQVGGTATLLVSSSGCHQQVQTRDEAATGEGTHKTNSYQPLSQFAEIAMVISDKHGLVLAKDAGGLHSPSQDVLHLCTKAQKLLRRNITGLNQLNNKGKRDRKDTLSLDYQPF
ncbi:hypothetical protein HPB47_006459 [Ixodes persulcatus]|uniref:Uncharacterized protein n=1 Tax=Ixodes persulcatus TaxID=34615 RepID=A0AC60PAU6_IXOPE|nr:hypothetical protein HPB47_006459 [Ixodes persulcatus]